jgi:hypothetical protein
MRDFRLVPKPVSREKKSKYKIKKVSTKQAQALKEYAQVLFHAKWTGQIAVVNNIDEALQVIGITK